MSGISGNYSKELAKSRENFNSTARKLKENYDKNIQDIEENNSRKEEQSKKVTDDRFLKLRDSNYEQLESFSNKTDNVLEQKQNEFLQGLKSDREQSNSSIKKTREDFQEKLGLIKESYQKSTEHLKDAQAKQDRDNEQKYFNGTQVAKINTDKKIQEMQKNTEKTINIANSDSVAQKKELTHRNQENVDEIKRDHHDEVERKTEYNLKKIQEITHNKDSEINNLNERYDFNMGKSKAEDKQLYDATLSRYEDHTKDLLRSFQRKYSRLEDNANLQMKKEKNLHDKELYSSEREKALYVDKNFKGEGVEGDKNVIKEHYEHRLSNVKKNMDDQSLKFQHEAEDINNNFKFEMKNRNLENEKKSDKREDQFRKEISGLVLKSRSNEEFVSDFFRDKLGEQVKNDEKRVIYERDTGTKKLENQRREFGKSVSKLSEISFNNIKKLKDENLVEKALIIENSKKEINQYVTDVKDIYRQKLDKTVESYDQRLQGQENYTEKIKEEADNKIELIARNNQKLIDAEIAHNLDARNSDKKIMQESIYELKQDFDQKIKKSKEHHDQVLSHEKKVNDVMLTRLTLKNEEEKTKLMGEHHKDVKKVTNELHDELVRFSKSARIEKDNLIETYERRIQDLKNTYDIEKIKLSQNKNQS